MNTVMMTGATPDYAKRPAAERSREVLIPTSADAPDDAVTRVEPEVSTVRARPVMNLSLTTHSPALKRRLHRMKHRETVQRDRTRAANELAGLRKIQQHD